MKRFVFSLVSVLLLSSSVSAQTTVAAATMARGVELPEPSYKAERIALLAAAVADIATTRMAIRNGATEGNPGLSWLVGKRPSTLKLVGVKLASIAVTELAARFHKRRGEHGHAKFLYWLTAALWGYAAGFNMSWAFK